MEFAGKITAVTDRRYSKSGILQKFQNAPCRPRDYAIHKLSR
jgi:hypothetical protein